MNDKHVKKLEKKFNTVFHKYYWFTCVVKELKLDHLLEKSEDDKKYKKYKANYYSYVILHNDYLEIVKEGNGLFFRGHAGTLKICFKDIVSIDKIKDTFFTHLLIKTDESLFGRTLELSVAKMEDINVLMDMFEDYKKSRNNKIVEPIEAVKGGVDDLLKYADLYERGLLTKEEFTAKDVGDKFDVIEYNRNKKLNVVVSGLLDRYYSFGVSVEDFIKKNTLMFQESAANNNLDMNLVVEKFKKKIEE